MSAGNFAWRFPRKLPRQRQRDELARLAWGAQYRHWAYMRYWVRRNNDSDGCRAYNRGTSP